MTMYQFDDQQVRMVLPHRKPMLMIDGVSRCNPELNKLTAHKYVSAAEPMLQVFPGGGACLPPTLVIEALAQSCGFLLNLHWLQANGIDLEAFSNGNNSLFKQSQIPHTVLAESRAKHSSIARPGTQLKFDSEIVFQRGGMIQCESIATNAMNNQVFTKLTVSLAVMENL